MRTRKPEEELPCPALLTHRRLSLTAADVAVVVAGASTCSQCANQKINCGFIGTGTMEVSGYSVLVVNVGTSNTWALSDQKARESGGRLPYVQEIRDWIQRNGGQLFYGDKWLATIDSSNEWVQAGQWGHCSGEMLGVSGLGSTHEQCMGHKPNVPGEVGTIGTVCTCQDTVVTFLCKPGTYSSPVQSGCSLCAAGTYSTGLGASSAGNCTACDPGTFSSAQGSSVEFVTGSHGVVDALSRINVLILW